MAAYGELVVVDGITMLILWNGTADRLGICFSLTESRASLHDARWDAPHESLEGRPFKARGISVTKQRAVFNGLRPIQ